MHTMNWGTKSAGTTGAESGHVIFRGCNEKKKNMKINI